MTKIAALVCLFLGSVAIASAAPTVPEIDANSAGSAIALLTGALLVIRGSRKK